MFKVKKGFTVIEIAIVVAIIAIIAGVWYVSKSKTGADVKMPGIGTTGTTGTGGKNTPPKIGMGTIWGYVKDAKNKPVENYPVSIVHSKCALIDQNTSTSSWYSTNNFGKYSAIVSPGDYCGFVFYWTGYATDSTGFIKKDINVKFNGNTKVDDFNIYVNVPNPKVQ